MPTLDELALIYHDAQQSIVARMLSQVLGLWSLVDFGDIDGSWAKVAPDVTTALTAGQTLSATAAPTYMSALLTISHTKPAPVKLRPGGFAGRTSAGIPWSAIINMVPIRAKQRVATGVSPAEAMDAGRNELTLIASTEAHDAGRSAMEVSMGVQPAITRYVRVPDAAACDRCMILAGKVYRHEALFLRHPRCGCTSRPLAPGERGDPSSPKRLFDGLSREEQDRRFGEAGADAIRAGAHPGQVVNAKKGMSAAGDLFTTQGSSTRSFAGKRLLASGEKAQKTPGARRRTASRLSPQGCRKAAAGDHERYLALLHRNGYIV